MQRESKYGSPTSVASQNLEHQIQLFINTVHQKCTSCTYGYCEEPLDPKAIIELAQQAKFFLADKDFPNRITNKFLSNFLEAAHLIDRVKTLSATYLPSKS